MEFILFETSKGVCEGCLVRNRDDLQQLKEYPEYFDKVEPEENTLLFRSQPYDFAYQLDNYDTLVVLPKSSIKVLSDYSYCLIQYESGWVKMELDDNHYGYPEWKGLNLATIDRSGDDRALAWELTELIGMERAKDLAALTRDHFDTHPNPKARTNDYMFWVSVHDFLWFQLNKS